MNGGARALRVETMGSATADTVTAAGSCHTRSHGCQSVPANPGLCTCACEPDSTVGTDCCPNSWMWQEGFSSPL